MEIFQDRRIFFSVYKYRAQSRLEDEAVPTSDRVFSVLHSLVCSPKHLGWGRKDPSGCISARKSFEFEEEWESFISEGEPLFGTGCRILNESLSHLLGFCNRCETTPPPPASFLLFSQTRGGAEEYLQKATPPERERRQIWHSRNLNLTPF